MPRSPQTLESNVRTPKTRLSQLLKKIELLKREAEAIRQKDKAEVIERIQEAIRFYGLTAQDLGLQTKATTPTSQPQGKPALKGSSRRRRSGVRYVDGQGNTWSGRGPRPRWLKEALAKGASLESLRAS